MAVRLLLGKVWLLWEEYWFAARGWGQDGGGVRLVQRLVLLENYGEKKIVHAALGFPAFAPTAPLPL